LVTMSGYRYFQGMEVSNLSEVTETILTS